MNRYSECPACKSQSVDAFAYDVRDEQGEYTGEVKMKIRCYDCNAYTDVERHTTYTVTIPATITVTIGAESEEEARIVALAVASSGYDRPLGVMVDQKLTPDAANVATVAPHPSALMPLLSLEDYEANNYLSEGHCCCGR